MQQGTQCIKGLMLLQRANSDANQNSAFRMIKMEKLMSRLGRASWTHTGYKGRQPEQDPAPIIMSIPEQTPTLLSMLWMCLPRGRRKYTSLAGNSAGLFQMMFRIRCTILCKCLFLSVDCKRWPNSQKIYKMGNNSSISTMHHNKVICCWKKGCTGKQVENKFWNSLNGYLIYLFMGQK